MINRDESQILNAIRLNSVHLAITTLDTARLHEAHVDLVAGKVDPHLSGRLERLLVLVDSTPWHQNFKRKAQEVATNIRTLIANLKNSDIEEAKITAGKLHGTYHSLVKDFYDWLPESSLKEIF